MVSEENFNTMANAAAYAIGKARAAEAEVERLNAVIEEMRRSTGKDTLERDTVTGKLEECTKLLLKIRDFRCKRISDEEGFDTYAIPIDVSVEISELITSLIYG